MKPTTLKRRIDKADMKIDMEIVVHRSLSSVWQLCLDVAWVCSNPVHRIAQLEVRAQSVRYRIISFCATDIYLSNCKQFNK